MTLRRPDRTRRQAVLIHHEASAAMILNNDEFIVIPGGEYPVGLSGDDLGPAYAAVRDDRIKKDFLAGAVPEHSVHAGPVMIRKFLTSCAEYARFVADTGYCTEAERDGWGWVLSDGRWHKRAGVDWKRPFGPGEEAWGRCGDTLPVMQVTWNDAVAYCAWLSAETGKTVRLPREAEWEVFARRCGVAGVRECAGGSPRRYGQAEYEKAVSDALRGGFSCSVGIVWEWTEDWYDRYPGGPDHRDFGRVYKVLRGGSLMSHPVQRCREFRLRKCPTARSPYYGFRIAVPGE